MFKKVICYFYNAKDFITFALDNFSSFIICRSWQYLSFEPRPVVFVRIVGVENTANEVTDSLN